ncbi:MAG: hypothetical protein RLY12_635, partial [Verrucomicrobiota bacterium]
DDDDKPARAQAAAEDIVDLPDVEEVDKDMEKNLRWDDEEEPAEEGSGESEGGESEGGAKGSGKSGRRR